MAGWLSNNSTRSSPGSWLHRRLAARARHPETFDCGVRVVAGTVGGEGPRWRYRVSAVDPLVADGVVTLHHGPNVALRLLVEPVPAGHGPRPGYRQLRAVEQQSGAQVRVSVDVGELGRFGVGLE
jgi:hypothetical protein